MVLADGLPLCIYSLLLSAVSTPDLLALRGLPPTAKEVIAKDIAHNYVSEAKRPSVGTVAASVSCDNQCHSYLPDAQAQSLLLTEMSWFRGKGHQSKKILLLGSDPLFPSLDRSPGGHADTSPRAVPAAQPAPPPGDTAHPRWAREARGKALQGCCEPAGCCASPSLPGAKASRRPAPPVAATALPRAVSSGNAASRHSAQNTGPGGRRRWVVPLRCWGLLYSGSSSAFCKEKADGERLERWRRLWLKATARSVRRSPGTPAASPSPSPSPAASRSWPSKTRRARLSSREKPDPAGHLLPQPVPALSAAGRG
ncbi:uncharacterized protein LOC101694416 [Mustela putorius furo]|uniref:Uncharacterized protein LOC101694416 n=1 Tax=Mustela putorius furo TaxID=9669 RepID=A0A8U0RYH9_MUSPF|nr:uncharacterized protein LOC101694416 [Mustela putorius furo]